MTLKNSDKKTGRHIKGYIRSHTFQKLIVGILAIIAAFAVVENGAVPKKYKLSLLDKSQYDITAPRDIENKLKTEENAKAAMQAVPPVMKRLDNVSIDVLNTVDDFFSAVDSARKDMEKSIHDKRITDEDPDYSQIMDLEYSIAAGRLEEEIKRFNLPLSAEQIRYLLVKADYEELALFRKTTRDMIGSVMKEDIDESILIGRIVFLQNSYQNTDFNQEVKNIGSIIVKSILKPNSTVDIEATREKQEEAYRLAKENRVIIREGTRILSVDDIVTEDKLQVLEELNLLESGKPDYVFAAGIFVVILLLASLLVLYMKFFCKKIIGSRNDIILLSVIVLLTLIIARVVHVYSPLLMPVFIAAMLISILLDLKLAIIVNFILTIALNFITKNDQVFMYMGMVSGSFSAFIVSRANQRSKLSAAGVFIALINVLIVVSMGLINKSGIRDIAEDSLIVSINGIVSTVLTIGLLPFFESTFNIISPLKLLELANPNQPLIKRLLLEAPGTYHHSLMVGNLAEVATEAINGNSLLARVGAYYHDIGKLKRPNFFIENQLSDNPHDRMTANLSTLVITSHTHDGAELAEKYKLPLAVREIVMQHHGDTLVAYFYHKAKKSDKGDTVKQEDFRYSGPRPTSKEAAVVMLADSVEAAVRSMVEKTEGKIEGLIRKIIKDKLDDGQLDKCDLTLKDLEEIAGGFMKVFSGFFHEREEYPDIKPKAVQSAVGELTAAGAANMEKKGIIKDRSAV